MITHLTPVSLTNVHPNSNRVDILIAPFSSIAVMDTNENLTHPCVLTIIEPNFNHSDSNFNHSDSTFTSDTAPHLCL